jgi:chaperonin GroES
MNLKPLADRLVVEPTEQEEVTAGGIILPETAKEKPQQGTVIAAGPGRTDDDGDYIKMEVKVGDKVLYAKYSGTEIKMEGKKVLILRESDVLAIVE